VRVSGVGVSRLVAPVLVVLAVAGYLAGHDRTQGNSAASVGAGETRVASGKSVQLEYPSGWGEAHSAPPIPGLAISDPLVLAPHGDPVKAGLLSGQIPTGQTSPLPDSFVSSLRDIPETEVVNLLDVQAYRYSHMVVSGYKPTVDLYVLPSADGSTAALACYASVEDSAYLKQCEQIVAKLTPIGTSPYDLTPDATYAGALATVVAGLDRERTSVRAEMGVSTTTHTLAGLSATLAERFAATAASLAKLEPPTAAAAAQAALVSALSSTSGAYRALADAAEAESASSGQTARTQVEEAEIGVDKALESFALLGYSARS
jgi:hypothetical protein